MLDPSQFSMMGMLFFLSLPQIPNLMFRPADRRRKLFQRNLTSSEPTSRDWSEELRRESSISRELENVLKEIVFKDWEPITGRNISSTHHRIGLCLTYHRFRIYLVQPITEQENFRFNQFKFRNIFGSTNSRLRIYLLRPIQVQKYIWFNQFKVRNIFGSTNSRS